MSVIALKVLNLNSEINKSLIQLLENHLVGVVNAGLRYSVKFVKSDGKTSYPRATFRGSTYIGISEIAECITNAVRTKRMMQPPIDDDLYRADAMSVLAIDADRDDDVGGNLTQNDIEAGAERYNRQRSMYGAPPIVASADSDNEPEPPKKQKKTGKSSSKAEHRASQKGGKRQQIIEQVGDNDIGATFRQQRFHNVKEKEESDLLENMFANMQSTPGF